jgi:hypothetical protein
VAAKGALRAKEETCQERVIRLRSSLANPIERRYPAARRGRAHRVEARAHGTARTAMPEDWISATRRTAARTSKPIVAKKKPLFVQGLNAK